MWVLAGDLTVTVCLGVAAILESCIRCGLIPSNVGYGELFAATTIGAQITDAAFAVTHASAGAQSMAKERLAEASRGTVLLNRNTLLKAHPLETGYVFWQEDISELADTEARLELTREELRETGDILKAEREQKARWLRLREENRLYDRIEQDTARSLSALRPDCPAPADGGYHRGTADSRGDRRHRDIHQAAEQPHFCCLAARHDNRRRAAAVSQQIGGQSPALRRGVPRRGEFAGRLRRGGYLPHLRSFRKAVVEESLGSLRSLLLVAEEIDGAVQTRICAAAGAPLWPLAARFSALEIEQDEDALWYLTFPKGGARE